MPLFFKNLHKNIYSLLKNESTWFWIFGIILSFIGATRYIAHSEYWSIYYSKYLFYPIDHQISLYSKFVFHFFLNLIHWLPLDNLAHLIAARFISVGLSLGILYFTYKILRTKFAFSISAIFIAYLFFNPLVFWDLPQLKADLFSLLFLLMSMFYSIQKRYRLTALTCFLAFLSTPKTILFAPYFLFFLFQDKKLNLSFNLTTYRKIWLARITIGLFVFYYFGQNLFIQFETWSTKTTMNKTYELAFRYSKELLNASAKDGYFSAISSYYVMFIVFYLLPVALIYFAFLAVKKQIKLTHQSCGLILLISAYSVLIVGLYPLKHPYFLIPVFFLWFISIIFIVQFNLTESKFSFFGNLMSFVLIAHFALSIFKIYDISYFNWGGLQWKLVQKLDEIVSINPNATIADGMGVLPRANNLPLFFGVNDPKTNSYSANQIIRLKPDLLFLTPKLAISYNKISKFVDENYVLIAPLIATKQVPIHQTFFIETHSIINRLKANFSFPIQTISFRSNDKKEYNTVLEATCEKDFSSKMSWTVDELISCERIFFRYIPVDKSGQETTVFAVPWPDYRNDWPYSTNSHLNFKLNQ